MDDGAGIEFEKERVGQTIIGYKLNPNDLTPGAVFIGSGEIYLKLSPDGEVTLHGTKEPDEAIKAVFAGLKIAISMNPYYRSQEL